MWRRFRRYLPFGLSGNQADYDDTYDQEDDEDDNDEDDRPEETSVDAPPGLLSDDEQSSPGFSSARSSFRRHGEKESPEQRRRRDRTVSAGQRPAEQQSPPKGKFLKRSSSSQAPRSSSAVSHRAEKQRKKASVGKRAGSPAPHSEGDAPLSLTENLTSRLSRRSSIISDLVALMVRRSSSMGAGGGGRRGSGRNPEQNEEQPEHGDEEEELEDEEDHSEDMGNLPRDKILERIRHHKEIIGKVRLQPWPMRRKRRALKVARQYLQKQEAQVSKWRLYKVELARRGSQAWRWVKNLSIYLIPWESKIKQIESNFGSVVSSYFIFLRWVLGMNVANSLLIMAFVVVPEWLADSQHDPLRFNRTQHIKVMPAKEAARADELNTVLDFGGYLQYSYLFYGYYSHETVLRGFLIAYNVPVAYVCVNLFLLVFCIFIILKKMTSNTRKSKLSSGKQEQYVFTWKVVNGWDYNIGEAETAASLAMANAIKLKEASTEYKKKFKQKLTFQKLFVRFIVNFTIFSMMFLSMLAIYRVAQITEKDTFIKQNAVSITVAAITLLFPPIFELILKLEQYRPRTALRIHLFRVLFFYLLNYFTLIYSLFIMLNTLEAEMRANEEWQKEPSILSSHAIRPYQYQFHIVHSPANSGSFNNNGSQSYYEVVSSPVLSSDSKANGNGGAKQRRRSRPFLLFASVSASGSERRREKREFVQKHARLGPKQKPKRRKRPTPGSTNTNNTPMPREGDGPKERDLNVLYSQRPFPGHEPASTTPEPTTSTTTRPWTTVETHFGPGLVGISNPKAIVLAGSRGQQQQELGTIWESRQIGPDGDWTATPVPHPLNYTSSPKFALTQAYRASNYDDLCWETLIGQEIAKIVTTDLVMTVAAIMVIDFIRGLWIRYCSDWWCWDIEATFPEYGEFKVAENVLHLVNSQAMVCLGTILVPMLPLINCVKLVVVMYIRAWACMVCNVPAKQIFRASRSSNFYFWLMLAFMCMSTLPVGFVIAYKRPSKNCGPFAGQTRFYSIIGEVLQQNLPKSMVDVISYFMSPGIIFPVFLLLVLIIYFLVLLVNGLRAANSDLNKQLTLERTEEKRKIFELAKGKRRQSQIAHKSRPSGESKKSSSGNGNGSADSGEGAQLLKGNGHSRGLSPLYFLNGAAKSALRKSWHGGTLLGNGGGEKGGEPEGILLNPLMPMPQKKQPLLSRQPSDASDGPHSPSKSPLRHAIFLPSLQSVDEKVDEEEADDTTNEPTPSAEHGHTEALIAKRKRSGTVQPAWELSPRRPSGQPSTSGGSGTNGHRRSSVLQPTAAEHRPSIRLSWKDRLLVCIGWTDPIQLEAKLRRQMEEAELERAQLYEEEPLLPAQMGEGEAVAGNNGTMEPVVLEEADYSVPSEQDDEEDEKSSTSRGETVLPGASSTPRLPSGLSQASSSRASQRPISVIQNRLADLLEEERPSSGSSAGTGSQRSWVRQQPAASPAQPKGPSPFPTTNVQSGQPTPSFIRRRTSSINGALEPAKRAVIERDHVSESSPLSQRRHSPFPTEELARLSPDKRHPLSPRAQAARGGDLPPMVPKQGGPVMGPSGDTKGRRPSRESGGSGGPQARHSMTGSGSGSSFGTRPPSDDLSLLLEEPSTPIGHFRPIEAELLGESFASSTGSDPRLQYANPYSSYAAAMCSPILPTESSESQLHSPIQSPEILSQISPLPMPLVLPMPFLRRTATTPPTALASSAQQRRPTSRQESPYQQTPSSSSAAAAPPLPRHGGQSPASLRRPSRESPRHDYAAPTPTMQRRRPSLGGRPEPIYDQPLDQRRPSGGTLLWTGDEGGSTSGRGTLPPGYGSSPASAGSSPEFGRPKYKISSMSPGRGRREQQQIGQAGESGSSPETSPRRRFEIRQRSGLGSGRPLRIPSQNGKNGNGQRNGQKSEEVPPGEKQSTV